jgi:hypothetical protein
MGRTAVIAFLLSICVSCKATADFSSDLQNIGLLLGIAESGGCAEVKRTGPGQYGALVIAVPAAHCSAEKRLGSSYSEYLALHSRELALAARNIVAPSSLCSTAIGRYHQYISNPSLLDTDDVVFLASAAEFPNAAVFPVADVAYEASAGIRANFASNGITDIALRSASYQQYMIAWPNYIVYAAIVPSGDPSCTQQVVFDAVSQVIPGWQIIDKGDGLAVRSRVVVGGICTYGPNVAPPADFCATLGPLY